MISDLIRNRRAVFPIQYNDKPIPKETIQKILEAANWAPTHKRTEPWRFKVIRGEHRKKLGEFMASKYQEIDARPKKFKIKKLLENPQRASAVILICMQRDPAESVPEWEEIASTAMAVQNMWLMCAALEIGCYWSSPALIQHMNEFVSLKDGERCIGLFYMGYHDQQVPTVERGPIEDKLEWFD